MNEWIDIFRAGVYPQGTWTQRDLDRVVASYDPKYHEAPLCLDHPPGEPREVLGIATAVRRAGSVLQARFRDVVPAVKGELQKLRKFSVSLYRDLDGRGPYLRHVGLVIIPAVKGLNANHAVFDDGDQAFEKFLPEDFHDDDPNADANDNPNPQGGTGVDPKEIEKLKADLAAANDALAKANADLAEARKATPAPGDDAAAKKAAADLAVFKEKAETAEGEVAKLKAAARRAETNAFLEKGVADGKILPGWLEMGLAEFLEALADGERDAVVSFAEGGKGSENVTPRKWAEKFLATLPRIVNFSQEATRQRAAAADKSGAADEFEEEGRKIAASLSGSPQGGK